jgi:hypothetical protein
VESAHQNELPSLDNNLGALCSCCSCVGLCCVVLVRYTGRASISDFLDTPRGWLPTVAPGFFRGSGWVSVACSVWLVAEVLPRRGHVRTLSKREDFP